jgi:hypothetical protein
LIASAEDLSRESLLVASGLSVGIGLLYCFYGYRLLRIVLAVTGFLAGAAAGVAFARSFDPDSLGVDLAGGLVGGGAGAVLLVLLYPVGVFLMGALLGVTIAMAVGAGLATEPPPAMLIGFAVIGGVVALALQKLIVVLVTATLGAGSVVTGAAALLGLVDPKAIFGARNPLEHLAANAPLLLVFWGVLALVGLFAQYTVLAPPPAAEGSHSRG